MELFNLHKPKETEYLKQQSSEMKALIDLLGEVETFLIEDPFICLLAQITFQSISFHAASKIWNRIYDTFSPMTPKSILKVPHEVLREIGLPHSKVKYFYNVANAFLNHEIRLDFDLMTDEEIIKEVTKIKGIGRWSAEMLLIFCLERPNVLSYGDQAIRKGIEWLYDIDHKITEEEFMYYKELFSPYGSTASHYIWEINTRALQRDKQD